MNAGEQPKTTNDNSLTKFTLIPILFVFTGYIFYDYLAFAVFNFFFISIFQGLFLTIIGYILYFLSEDYPPNWYTLIIPTLAFVMVYPLVSVLSIIMTSIDYIKFTKLIKPFINTKDGFRDIWFQICDLKNNNQRFKLYDYFYTVNKQKIEAINGYVDYIMFDYGTDENQPLKPIAIATAYTILTYPIFTFFYYTIFY